MGHPQLPALTVSDRWDGSTATLTVSGEVDITTAPLLRQHLTDMAQLKPGSLIIDLADVSFMDSTGLAAFIRIRKTLPSDCPVTIRSPHPRVRRIFQITRLDTVFLFEP